MADLKPSERIQLQRLINESECEDNTDSIRRLKHSVLIRDDIRKIDTLRNTELDDKNSPAFRSKCIEQCPFLFNNYTELFNKMIKGELDLTIMTKLLTVLKLIEDDKVDQHEGSVMVGKILKELYIDSVNKQSENLDKQYSDDTPTPVTGKTLSWKEYKRQKM